MKHTRTIACALGVVFSACQNPASAASRESIRGEDQPTAPARVEDGEDD